MSKTTPWSRLSSAGAPPQQPSTVQTICVIGAGPSGIVAAKHLREAGYTVTVLGKDGSVQSGFPCPMHMSNTTSRTRPILPSSTP